MDKGRPSFVASAFTGYKFLLGLLFFFFCGAFLSASSFCVVIDTKSLLLISYGVLLRGAPDSNYRTIDFYLKLSLSLQTSDPEKLGFQKPQKDYFRNSLDSGLSLQL